MSSQTFRIVTDPRELDSIRKRFRKCGNTCGSDIFFDGQYKSPNARFIPLELAYDAVGQANIRSHDCIKKPYNPSKQQATATPAPSERQTSPTQQPSQPTVATLSTDHVIAALAEQVSLQSNKIDMLLKEIEALTAAIKDLGAAR